MERPINNNHVNSSVDADFSELMDFSYDMAKKLLPFLARRRIPLTPENYHLFYDYFLGSNPELTRQLNEALQKESLFTPAVSNRIYKTFYEIDSEHVKVLTQMGEQIETISTSLEENLGQSLDSTGRFQHFLNDSVSQIEHGQLRAEEMKRLVDSLLSETKNALDSQSALADLMEASNKVIVALTEELKDKTRQANIDDLTQLYNRRFMKQRFGELIHEFSVGGFKSLSMAIFDLDRFKTINDTWGHSVGDKVLVITSKIIKSFAGDYHVACRYGGEEFVILFVGLEETEVESLTESIRKKLEETQITIRGENIPVTISAGISYYVPGEDEIAFITRADKALYEAKAAGRNQVKVARE
ncbi:MAG: GGDEF domain-containing protein [Deltaproteobacteria bacterium]|nr:GGDEF domain-containing protein [Deltaproteobacteria bacterium]